MNEREAYLIRNRFRMNEKPSEEDIFSTRKPWII